MTADTDAALVEKVALAMGNCIRARHGLPPLSELRAGVTTGADELLEEARAALAAVSPAIEALSARVAVLEGQLSDARTSLIATGSALADAVKAKAAAIRAMKGTAA